MVQNISVILYKHPLNFMCEKWSSFHLTEYKFNCLNFFFIQKIWHNCSSTVSSDQEVLGVGLLPPTANPGDSPVTEHSTPIILKHLIMAELLLSVLAILQSSVLALKDFTICTRSVPCNILNLFSPNQFYPFNMDPHS